MFQWFEFDENEFPSLLEKLPDFLSNQSKALILESSPTQKNNFSILCAFGSIKNLEVSGSENSFDCLKHFLDSEQAYAFGHLSYDLKNEIELLKSIHKNNVGFKNIDFFIPERIVKISNSKKVTIGTVESREDAFSFLTAVNQKKINESKSKTFQLSTNTTKKSYIYKAKELIEHIHRGDIYEVNFCIEFFAENIIIDPIEIFKKLNSICEAPFSALYKNGDQWLICASPERFLQKKGNKLISQPIKGTRPRGKTMEEDDQLKKELFLDPKERSENVMIVDLVRNDLSKSSKKGSVKVDELFGIHTFKTVHQMVSTVSAEIGENVHRVDAIQNAFPMGSMTGAPKVRAMELAEEFEDMKRGLYSGAVGYFSPDGDFDFNVVIRSIQYNAKTGYLSIMVGSALTANADPEKEYEECLLKAKALFESLDATLIQD